MNFTNQFLLEPTITSWNRNKCVLLISSETLGKNWKWFLRKLPILFWYIFFRESKLGTLIMGSKLSCCFRVEQSLPEQELEVLRDVQMEVECTAASNFIPTQQPHKIRVSCLIWTSKHLSVNVLFVKNISSTGIKVPATTSLGSGVPTSVPTTSQSPRWRRVGLPQLLHTLPLVLGPKEEWTQGEWNPGCYFSNCR